MKTLKNVSITAVLFSLIIGLSFSTSQAQVEEDIATQPETYSLEAEVVDWETDDSLSDAQVIVTGMENLNTMTDAQGEFILEGLTAETYTIQVKLEGYKTWEKQVAVNEDKQIEIKLKPVIN